MPPSDPPVSSPDHVLIDFPLDGWSFQATFQPAGQRCGRMQTVPLHRTVQGFFVLRHAGHAGIYDVTLFGRGSGDLVTVFRWSTPSDGPLPVPKSRLASWPATMDSSTATASSSRHQIWPRPRQRPPRRSPPPPPTANRRPSRQLVRGNAASRTAPSTGTAPDDQGLAAAALGPAPFTYKVVLNLDGRRHVATADWPADVIRGNEPSVTLNFTPASRHSSETRPRHHGSDQR
jgi:hypothetical protein